MNYKVPFEFGYMRVAANPDTFVHQLPAGLTSKEELLRALCEGLRFPGYFGFNWDALSECLRDFHWMNERTIVLSHADNPRLPSVEYSTYLEVLAHAVGSWGGDDEHWFRVVFPAAEREAVLASLGVTTDVRY